jgi:two-component system sensor histidine kinase RegB
MSVANDNASAGSLPVTGLRLIQMRWWLLAGLAGAVLSGPTFIGVSLPWQPLLAVLLLMAAFNLIARRRIGAEGFDTGSLTGQLTVDLTGMGVMLYLSGGATNPLVFLLLLPVAVGALLLPARRAAAIAALAIGLYSFLMLYSLPLPIADAERATRLHLAGMWLTFVVSAALIAWFVTRMTASLRARDAALAKERERALRDAQVIALGQLAAGAAHELGTPLATVKVLAGELARDERLPAEAREDLALLQEQVDICKEIVSGLTCKAGIGRVDTLRAVPLNGWLDGLVARWRALWPQASCLFDDCMGDAAPHIAVDAAIEQAVVNLLNNAAKAAPYGIRLVAEVEDDCARISITDQGPGFPAGVLQRCGAEPMPAHDGGEGIGLWLTRAAVERAGGRLHLENTESGGVARVTLPLGERR